MRIDSISTNARSVQDAKNAQYAADGVTGVKITELGEQKRADVESDEVINDAMLENSVKAANANLVQYNRMIERTVHEKTHTIMYVLKDSVTKEVIREFPPRKIQDMIAKMWELAGLFVDERR
ncbi:MAG: flagellar protein FlaG [Clostridia bacterium]|nr:flagellar protein FlaG [Clostridia bacterium]